METEREKYNIVDTSAIRKMAFPEYYLTVDGFASTLNASDIFNANRPPFVPGGDTFLQHLAVMKELGVGAERGDSLLREQRQNERNRADLNMDASISYMKIIAIHKQDPSILYTLGLPFKDTLRNNTSHKSVIPEAIPIEAEVKTLKGESGAIAISCTHVRNGGPYLVNLCQGKPVSEDSWYNPGGHYSSCKEIVLRSLQRASEYYARVRTDGPNGPGPWSNVVSIVVI